MARVFLSHSHHDKDNVRVLARDLNANGIDVWLDEWEIHVGDPISQKIDAGIADSDFLAIWITHHAVSSNWVDREWRAKLHDEVAAERTMILPLLAEDVKLPPLLQDKSYADFRDDYQAGLKSLLGVPGITDNSKRGFAKRALFVLAGPSGVGKDVIQNRVFFRLQQHHRAAYHLQKYTTRSPRPGEKEGEPYFHFDKDESAFDAKVADGTIACVHSSFGSYRYGCDSYFRKEATPGSAVLYNIRYLGILKEIIDRAEEKGLVVRKILLKSDLDSLLNRINQRTAKAKEKAKRSETARADTAFIEGNDGLLEEMFDLTLDNSDHSALAPNVDQVYSFIENTLTTVK